MKLLTICQAALVLSATASAQLSTGPAPLPSAQAPGSLTTYFVSNVSYGGNMFDIEPKVDMEITGMDLNCSALGSTVEVEIWIKVGSSIGDERNHSGAWFELMPGKHWRGVGAGSDLPTFVSLAGNGYTFQAGQTYGVFVDLMNVSPRNSLNYTSAPTQTYSNSQLSITTHCGRGIGGFTSFVFPSREWNGTIYYDDAPGTLDPVLTVSNLNAGETVTIELSNVPDGNMVISGYSLTGGGPITTRFGQAYVSRPIITFPAMTVANGMATWNASVPVHVSGTQVWFQALDISSGRLSNPLALTVN